MKKPPCSAAMIEKYNIVFLDKPLPCEEPKPEPKQVWTIISDGKLTKRILADEIE